MPRRRLGIAILLPEPTATEVDGLRRACGDGSLGRIPAHITLVPPVNVREEHVGEALAILRTAASATPAFPLTLGPPSSFAPVTPVLYLQVQGSPTAVRGLRDRVFTGPLARRLTHPFVPHVTLAEELPADRIEAALGALADYRAEIVVDRVHLLQEGADRVWAPIADAPLAPAAVVGRGGLELELTATDRLDPEGRALVPGRPFAVTARRDGAVVGVAEGWTEGDTAVLARLVVAPEHRGQGVARQLRLAVESLAADRGCTRTIVLGANLPLRPA